MDVTLPAWQTQSVVGPNQRFGWNCRQNHRWCLSGGVGVFGMWCVLRHVHVSLGLEASNLERQTLQLHMKMASTQEIQEKDWDKW